MKLHRLLLFALLSVAGFAAVSPNTGAAAALQGRFDNREQVAKTSGGAEHALPHVTITIEPTAQKDFTLWHVHIETDAESKFDQTWAMQTRSGQDGGGALIPYYQLKQDTTPDAATFDEHGWLSLEACALRGTLTSTRIEAISEGEPCVAVSMNVGARRALLPVGIVWQDDSLQLDFNLRGERTRIDAKPVR